MDNSVHGDGEVRGVSRREALGLAAAATVGVGAAGLEQAPSAHANAALEVEDSGPAVVGFPLMNGLVAGATLYVGSRNIAPVRVAAYHLPSQTVTTTKNLDNLAGTVQALTERNGILYAANHKSRRIYAWNLTTDQVSFLTQITGLERLRALAVAPDGTVYATGKPDGRVYEVDPTTGNHTRIATVDPSATQALAIAALSDRLIVGSGSHLPGGSSGAGLWSVNRVTRAVTSILPPQLADDIETYGVDVIGGRIYAMTDQHLAVLDESDNSVESVNSVSGKNSRRFVAVGSDVYFGGSPLRKYSTITQDVTEVASLPGLTTTWGIGQHNGTIVVARGGGVVASYNLATQQTDLVDLISAGARGDAQLAMGIAAGSGRAYVGGNNMVAEHNLSAGTVSNLDLPGEAKDMVVVGTTLYAAMYSQRGLWTYDPTTPGGPTKVADFPTLHNRPRDVHWASSHDKLLIGLRNDSQGGGSLMSYDASTGQTDVVLNPFAGRSVNAVDGSQGKAYIGSGAPGNGIKKFDIGTLTQEWAIAPDLSPGSGIISLLARGASGLLFGITGGPDTTFFVIDLSTRSLVHKNSSVSYINRARLAHTWTGPIYGASRSAAFRIDPTTFQLTKLINNLNGQYFSGPRIEKDENWRMYTMSGLSLIRFRET